MFFNSIYAYLGDFPNVLPNDTDRLHAGGQNYLTYWVIYIALQNLFISRNGSERDVRRSSYKQRSLKAFGRCSSRALVVTVWSAYRCGSPSIIWRDLWQRGCLDPFPFLSSQATKVQQKPSLILSATIFENRLDETNRFSPE